MKLTKLSPAPLPVGGAGSCPRRPILTRAPLRSLSPVLDPLISGTTERIGAQGEAGDPRASRACWAGGRRHDHFLVTAEAVVVGRA